MYLYTSILKRAVKKIVKYSDHLGENIISIRYCEQKFKILRSCNEFSTIFISLETKSKITPYFAGHDQQRQFIIGVSEQQINA